VLKSFAIISLSFIVTLSILAPAVVSLTNDMCSIVMEDFNDDEREDSEEKEIEEIDSEENEKEKEERFCSSLITLDNFFIVKNTTNTIFFIERVSTYSLEIQLPPPEYNI